MLVPVWCLLCIHDYMSHYILNGGFRGGQWVPPPLLQHYMGRRCFQHATTNTLSLLFKTLDLPHIAYHIVTCCSMCPYRANCFSSVNGSDDNSTCRLMNSERVAVYTATTLMATIFSFCRAILFCFLCINTSRILHNRMFDAVLHAKVLFFDTNPVGKETIMPLVLLLSFIMCAYIQGEY